MSAYVPYQPLSSHCDTTTFIRMDMIFHQSVTTPLFSAAWAPAGQASYAGTCVFLIVLALVHRILQAAIHTVLRSTRPSNDTGSAYVATDVEGKRSALARQLGTEWHMHPFELGTEIVRGLIDVFVDGIGYLL
jgi:solute carrier family 31 (copper transporter), member 1